MFEFLWALHGPNPMWARTHFVLKCRTSGSNSDGHVTIKAPFTKQDGEYYIEVSILGAEGDGNELFAAEYTRTFDFYWNSEDIVSERQVPEFAAVAVLILVFAFSMIFLASRFRQKWYSGHLS